MGLTTIIQEIEEFVSRANIEVSKINLSSSQNPTQFYVITTVLENNIKTDVLNNEVKIRVRGGL
jgi:hypothetical protein